MTPEKKRIFIVDDDESVCRAMKLLLESYDFLVQTFNSAEVFLSTVANSTLGSLILDIHMPGLDGWATLQRLRKSGSKRAVIIISAQKNGELKEKSAKAGANGFLQKPFNDQELIALLGY